MWLFKINGKQKQFTYCKEKQITEKQISLLHMKQKQFTVKQKTYCNKTYREAHLLQIVLNHHLGKSEHSIDSTFIYDISVLPEE